MLSKRIIACLDVRDIKFVDASEHEKGEIAVNYTENAANVLTAKSYKGIGKAWIVKHLKGDETVSAIVSLLNNSSKGGDLTSVNEFEKRRAAFKVALDKLHSVADGAMAFGDAGFPSCRGNVKNSEQPVFLLYRGDLGLLQPTNRNVAVIGLLNPDHDTEMLEREVVAQLVKSGATIVSGLALGCDTIAHRQTLDSGGKTVAILPSSLNNIIPAVNRDLADEIARNDGLLVTEYHDEPKSRMELTARYQERDRLQALFSDGVLLSASYAKNDQGNDSGARLAMQYALDYSIPRAVVYDAKAHADRAKYDLNRQLISEQGDIVVIDHENLVPRVEQVMAAELHREDGASQASLGF